MHQPPNQETWKIKATIHAAMLDPGPRPLVDGEQKLKMRTKHDTVPTYGLVYLLPADAESYERMVEQMDVVIEKAINRWLAGYGGQDDLPRAALRAIGITPPKKGRK